MKAKNKDYNFSVIRVLFCLAILFYHLGLLKGGYLAVCSLFALAGYFSTISLTRKIKLLPYYKKRLVRIYYSLIVVLFCSIAVIWFMNIDILNLKSEVKSILLGYNNYWQLHANSDYFAKNIASPFTHLWYMSILIQLQFAFALVYIILKKIGDKVHRSIPCITLFLVSIASTLYFCHVANTRSIMFTYYDTFSRMFSFMIGTFLGSFHMYYNKLLILPKNKTLGHLTYVIYILILMILFACTGSSTNAFKISFIVVTLITIRLIEEGILLYKNDIVLDNKIVNFISNISYEIYLVQYPVIYFFGYAKINFYLKVFSIILITVILSWLIHMAMKTIKDNKFKILIVLTKIIVIIATLFGMYQFAVMKDHSKEMNQLKESLADKEEVIKQRQKEYMEKQKQEQEEWDKYINSLEIDEEKLNEYVTNLKIVGVGDSIMLDPVNSLYKEFPNGYFDAKVSRSTCAAYDVLKGIKESGITWDVLVFNLGTNGYPNDKCKNNLMSLAGDNKVFWLNATHADYDNNNSELEKYAAKHDNIYILDWVSVAQEHPEYIYPDKTHLRPNAFKPYAKFIKDEIYKVYLEEYNSKKEEDIKKAKENKKEKITFYGNDLLINVFDKLQEKYPDAKFEADTDFNKNELFNNIESDINKKMLNDKLVFIYDKQSKLKEDDYKEIANLCKDKKVYIVVLDDSEINIDNITVINLNLTKDDYLHDKIHLTDKANDKLIKEIDKILK